ncbi:hypothetical protein AVEN_257628-1 [Araneus ventricosus]|uniref:Uncharacterized protein n=1 Tax=Araneus ventricosus TaxID=182803 RepID=A0A4Y2E7E4_ARAVE|nr:hypothetical protein AVEN_257628-1 [Araneus ventricosus]
MLMIPKDNRAISRSMSLYTKIKINRGLFAKARSENLTPVDDRGYVYLICTFIKCMDDLVSNAKVYLGMDSLKSR